MKSQTGQRDGNMRASGAAIVGSCDVRAFGSTPHDRLSRQLGRVNLTEVAADQAELILSGAHVFGNSVLNALAAAQPGCILIDDAGRVAGIRVGGKANPGMVGQPAADGVPTKTGAALAGRYDQKLRKRTDPMVMAATDSRAVEQALFDASYKGVTDLVTKHAWPKPALAVTRWCAARSISPNQVTWASAVLVGVTFWLFWIGAFLPGLAVAYVMTFLDTVDGKLARVTLTSSRFGDWLDHGIDLVHPPFWWWAWAIGCTAIGDPLNDGGLVMGAIVAGYILQRAEEGLFIARFGIEMHIWRPFDSLFRQITARRNPNLVILTVFTLLGAPREGLIAVAIWVVLCLLVHLVRILQAFGAERRGPLVPWLARD